MKAFLVPLLAAIPLLSQAASDDYSDLFPTGSATPEPVISHMYYSPNPALSPQEEAGLKISEKWRSNNKNALKPLEGDGGVVTFVFGAAQPSVVCAVMQVCDIELQAGETVTGSSAGDTARWEITPSRAGSGDNAVWHIIIKPKDVGLETSLLITTDRRTYHITLRSHRDQYMARVAFTYPDDSDRAWAAYRRHVATEQQQEGAPSRGRPTAPKAESNEYLGNLDFNYDIEGSAPWKPVRVFNDGTKTIIQMPKSMRQTEAPVLVVLRGSDSAWPWGHKAEEVMVNYRVQDNRIIVDTVFDKAKLIAGVGSQQDRIEIKRTNQ